MTFEQYLIEKGYKEVTPSGQPSTVYEYNKSVHNVLLNEEAGVQASDTAYIKGLVKDYDRGGSKEKLGDEKNRTCINALKQYLQYLESRSN